MTTEADKAAASIAAIGKVMSGMLEKQSSGVIELRSIIESQTETINRQEREIERLKGEIERISRNCPSEHW